MASTSAKIVFYTNPVAFNPAKVAVMLAEKRIPHQTVKVDILGTGGLQPSFIRINPAGTAPVIKADEKIITESLDCCLYLDSYDSKPLGGDTVDRQFITTFLQELNSWDGNLYGFANMSPGILGTLDSLMDYRIKFAEARAKENPDLADAYAAKIKHITPPSKLIADTAKVSANLDQLHKLLDTAASRLVLPPPAADTAAAADAQPPPAAAAAAAAGAGAASRTKFLAGDDYSVADAMLAPVLFRITSLGKHKQEIASRPPLADYMRRVRDRPSWQAAFGTASSTVGQLTNFLPALIKSKIANLFKRY